MLVQRLKKECVFAVVKGKTWKYVKDTSNVG